eukprot:15437144-Alexandrium_andersonii.AAC.1
MPSSVAPVDLRAAGPASGPASVALCLEDEAPGEAAGQQTEVRFVDWPEPGQLRGATPEEMREDGGELITF